MENLPIPRVVTKRIEFRFGPKPDQPLILFFDRTLKPFECLVVIPDGDVTHRDEVRFDVLRLCGKKHLVEDLLRRLNIA